jgi:hypothetical protein
MFLIRGVRTKSKKGEFSLVHHALNSSQPTLNASPTTTPHLSSPFNPKTPTNNFNSASCKMTTRVASHAGSWYSSRASTLSGELDEWLAQVPTSIDGKELPVPGARVIIAP